MKHSELTRTITASGRSAYYVDEVDMLVAQLKAALKLHKHTDECLAYAAKTGKAFCIVECRDSRR